MWNLRYVNMTTLLYELSSGFALYRKYQYVYNRYIQNILIEHTFYTNFVQF